ncbi:hypothetical protein IQ07DRAFT_218058 [Pyrenochaeta sp. DS3sAY3a]|nr:hypothetical protein IQ07DRAFT_218058 [Pyrenochaeta sp. DS3sAY3a]
MSSSRSNHGGSSSSRASRTGKRRRSSTTSRRPLPPRLQAFMDTHIDYLRTATNFLPANTECPICFENVKSHLCVRITGIEGCNHMIGLDCLKEMLAQDPDNQKTCPMCRTEWIPAVNGGVSDAHEWEDFPGNSSSSALGWPVGVSSSRNSSTAGPSRSGRSSGNRSSHRSSLDRPSSSRSSRAGGSSLLPSSPFGLSAIPEDTRASDSGALIRQQPRDMLPREGRGPTRMSEGEFGIGAASYSESERRVGSSVVIRERQVDVLIVSGRGSSSRSGPSSEPSCPFAPGGSRYGYRRLSGSSPRFWDGNRSSSGPSSPFGSGYMSGSGSTSGYGSSSAGPSGTYRSSNTRGAGTGGPFFR